MSYMQRSSIEEPLKNSQKINKLQIPNSSYLKSFKKTLGQSSKVKNQSQHHSFTSEPHFQDSKFQNRGQLKEKQKNQLQHLSFVMQQTDNSMEELLNSSINHFQRLIIHQEEGQSLEEQNHRLKNALCKIKSILRDKLQIALQKQKEQLSKMLEDYISLITKLLQDKQELTIKIQDIAEESQKKIKQVEAEFNRKLDLIKTEKEEQIGYTRNQIDQFLSVIEQYDEEAKQEQQRFSQMQEKIEILEEERDSLLQQLRREPKNEMSGHQNEYSMRIQAQSVKIQTLLELLQKCQRQNNELKAELGKRNKDYCSNEKEDLLKQVKQFYDKKLAEMEAQYEQQFLEYQKTVKDTLNKKEECIERLNLLIENLRQKKSGF